MTASVRRLLIVGAGGYGRLLQDAIQRDPSLAIAGFIDPAPLLRGTVINGVPVLGGDDMLPALRAQGISAAVAAVGNNRIRAAIFNQLAALGFELPAIVHATASIATHVSLGRGAVVLAAAVVNVNATLGDNVVINTAATIDHDDVVRDHAQVWPGAHLAGNVTVGEYAYIGIGASVIPGITIGEGSIVGAGAAVVRDIPPHVTAVGVPARVIKVHAPEGS